MGLDIQQILVGDSDSFLDSFLVKKNKLINDNNKLSIFLMIDSVDKILQNSGSKLNSISSITYINDNSFLKYENFKKKKYKLGNIIIPYGFGSYFHTVNNKKFRIISVDKASINSNPVFLTNHPVCDLISPFSKSFNYKCGEGLCDFQSFNYLKYLTKQKPGENYSVKLIALNGHVHLNDKEILFNDNSEFYFENPFFIKDPKQISDFIKLFRNYENSYKINTQNNNNFNYSTLMLSHKEKYYYYTEATSLNDIDHHDRLGIITELTPDKSGMSASKISLINYFECLNNLKFFQKKVKSNNLNYNSFISNVSSKLSLLFK
jgi:hypothetical protein